ncbi:MAG: acyl-CoA dehydratase activase [Bacillota bacterium]|nr:acyl-CoA dehydratase activase [Bacillota bacterium]
MSLGIDIGSTTVKLALLDENNNIIYKYYGRHFSKVRQKTTELIEELAPMLSGKEFRVAVTGSAGLGVARSAGLSFVQEVYAAQTAIETFLDGIDVVVELGGEDAKIIFLTGGFEERMNGTCAGGTGAFIDQMASLMSLSIEELDSLSFKHEKIYNIASRCGVFAKSDIQPLLNQGARKEDIAASIYQAIVNQTIAGLAQGRRIAGRVAFLGGPLSFQMGLRERFVETLKLSPENAVFPEDARYYIAIGAALCAYEKDSLTYDSLLESLKKAQTSQNTIGSLPVLFESREAYDEFVERHNKVDAEREDLETYTGDAYLGVDAGSTTTKLALITPDGKILYSYYGANLGEPIKIVKYALSEIYELSKGRVKIRGSASTGYGEELIRNAFCLDSGIVETVAHFFAAKHFNPNVDFILDIGGQDIKCFHIRNGAVDSIMLNEACSSGCGSFIETLAGSLGYSVEDFAKLSLFAKHPVNLGSRCTVFMNSSVKQAQKDGSTIEDISAGIAVSVIKNAIYKVIRAKSTDELGKNIVVQGGTFMNDAVLRSFELETGKQVTRPAIAGLMGAYGAAMYAFSLKLEKSGVLSPEGLAGFSHKSKPTSCGLCPNRCKLTVNTFSHAGKFISGNRCERPLGGKSSDELPNAYDFKLKLLAGYKPVPGRLGKIGLPMGLNMFENLPFWHTLLTELGFEVVRSGISTHETYIKGQYSIPSDTVCYPAKLMHGHIEELVESGVETIFYPCMTYNFKECDADNNYNCPVVAYYPELLKANMYSLSEIRFLFPYFAPHIRKTFTQKAMRFFHLEFCLKPFDVRRAIDKAYLEYAAYREKIREFGRKSIEFALEHSMNMIVLAGRPYHVDPEINHGIDRLIASLGFPVLSEDCVSDLAVHKKARVLNQWTYHTRLYNAAEYVKTRPDMQLVQLISFGCGIDAITSDEVREILESGGKFYTQIKIDEINNLGATKIRLRSLKAAMETDKAR